MPIGIDGNGIITGVSDFSSSNVSLTDPEITGGVYLGGTGSANYLDDYEEGTFTVSDGSGAGLSITSVGYYCKVGGLVYFGLVIEYPSNTNNDDTELSGLPFLQKKSTAGRSNFIGWHNLGTGIMSLSQSDGTSLFFYRDCQDSNARFTNSDLSGSKFYTDGVYPVS